MIYGHDPTTNAECNGSVTVVVNGQATIDEILSAATDYVDSGGIRWGQHGRSICTADLAILESVSMGAIANPAVTITGTTPTIPPRPTP